MTEPAVSALPTSPAPPPRAWLAILLSLLVLPGLGHVLRGRWQRGLGWMLVGSLAALSMMHWCIVGATLYAIVRIASAIDSVLTRPTDPLPSGGLAFLLVLGLFGLHLMLAVILRVTVAQPFKVPAGSMIPTLEVGDHMLVSKLAYVRNAPARGDVIVFHYPKNPQMDFVKRVIAVGGDTVELRNDEVILNGQPLPHVMLGDCSYEDYSEDTGWTRNQCSARGESVGEHHYRVYYAPGAEHASFAPVKVPPDSFYVLGDNRDNSHDSRYWGFVPRAMVIGRAEHIWLSNGRNGVRLERMPLRIP